MSKNYSQDSKDQKQGKEAEEEIQDDLNKSDADLSLSLMNKKAEENFYKSRFMNVITFRQNDNFKLWWDSLILIFAIWNCFTVPLVLFFDEIDEMLAQETYYDVINWISIFLFITDIILQMNTTYYDSDGEEIEDKKKIVRHYIMGMFVIDFISALPIEKLFPGSSLRIFNILKIVRLTKLGDIINKANFDEETKSMLRISKLIFTLILVMHVVGCFWHAVCIDGGTNDLWIPPLDFVWASKYPQIYSMYEKDITHRYLIFLYNAVLFLGGNEMGPRSDTEIAVCIIILIFMSIFNAWLFGDMAVQ